MAWNPYDNLPPAASFSLTSSDLKEGEKLAMPQVSGVFGAGGQDVSPQLSWSGFPSATKSFVVTMCDPEAPTVTGFWHWAVVNIPANVTELPAGAGDESGSGLPPGAFQLPNDARLKCYVGAGPPEGHGRHRYIFAVLALAADKIEIDREATPALLMFNLFNGTLGRAFLEGWYERSAKRKHEARAWGPAPRRAGRQAPALARVRAPDCRSEARLLRTKSSSGVSNKG